MPTTAERCARSITTFGEAIRMISTLGGYAQEAAEPVAGDDRSFRITCGGAVVGVMPVFVTNSVACSCDGTSIIPFCKDENVKQDVCETICRWANDILDCGDVGSIKILADEPLLAALLRRSQFSVSDNTRLYGYFDLRRDKGELWQSIRKSYRSLIRKGERHFRRAVYGGKTLIEPEVIDFLVASPRTNFRYDVDRVRRHMEEIPNNEAMLFAYWFDAALVAVVGISSWRKFAASGDHFYELGAYDHSCGVPTHFCLYDALNYYQSHGLGSRVFLLHGVPAERPETQSKLRAIDFYKLGYCSDTFTHPYKVVTLANS